jgi:ribonuclease T2
LRQVNFRFVLAPSGEEDMSRRRMRQLAHLAAIAFSFTFIFAIVALAQDRNQDRRQGEPGQFDFYVLALSWSPTYCEAAHDRAPDRAPDPQCAGRPFTFVVHGLWPQYERGFPSYCQVPAPRLDRAVVASMLDLMPSPRLIFHEWDRHGTCSGFSPRAYFEAVRKARAVLKIPPNYLELDKPVTVTPSEVAEAFIKANPGLSRAAMAVSCDGKRLTEIRFCLGRDLVFRDCPEIARRACRLERISMPAIRKGS